MYSLYSKSFSVIFAVVVCFLYFAVACQAQGNRVEYHDQMTYGRISGWEKDLTYRDPNLSHWHWEPIGVSAHIRSQKVFNDSNPAAQQVRRYVKTAYVKPIHLPLPNSEEANGGRTSSSDVSGRVIPHNRSHNNLLAQSPVVATYPTYSSTNFSSSGSSKSALAGKLLRNNKF